MFNTFEASDEHKREEKTKERLDILRRAYKAGYFDEEGSESLPEIVSDGINPTDLPGALVHNRPPIGMKPPGEALYDAVYNDRPDPCCTCGRNPHECKHACICWINDEDDARDCWLKQYETRRFETTCRLCAGFGTGYDGTECSACNGTGTKGE